MSREIESQILLGHTLYPMIDFKKHFERLQAALGVKNPLTCMNCADTIDAQLWRDEVMKAIDEISIESADELQ